MNGHNLATANVHHTCKTGRMAMDNVMLRPWCDTDAVLPVYPVRDDWSEWLYKATFPLTVNSTRLGPAGRACYNMAPII